MIETIPSVVNLFENMVEYRIGSPVLDDVVAPPFDVTPYLAATHYAEQLSLLSRLRVRQPTRGRCVTDVVAVDLFAGGGGASLGIEQATDQSPIVAVNHDWHAIQMHMANHPLSIHFHRDVWEVPPGAAVNGAKVDLLWASPDCTDHSRAKGGKPRSKDLRALAWVIVEWAAQVQPAVIAGENVPEFVDWGPLYPSDYPDKDLRDKRIRERRGQTFDAFKLALGPGCPETHPAWEEIPERVRPFARKGCGYIFDHRKLNAANYGAPTTRERLYFIARRDGEPIRWPEPTHGPGRAQPWRAAAECLDFEEPSLSIFATPAEAKAWAKEMKARGRKVMPPKRPLADATMRRIAEGIRRFVLTNADPFIVVTGHQSSDGGKVRPVAGPLSTIVTKAEHCLLTPVITKFYGASVGSSVEAPVPTQVEKAHLGLIAPILTKFYGTSKAGASVEPPMPTATALAGGGHLGVVEPILVCTTHQDSPDKPVSACRIGDVQQPVPTITGAHRGEWAEVEATMEPQEVGYTFDCECGSIYTVLGSNLEQPCPSCGDVCGGYVTYHYEMTAPLILRAHGKGWDRPGKASGVTKPGDGFPTITATEEWAVMTPVLVQTGYGEREGQTPRALDVSKPLGTVVSAGGKHALVSAFLAQHNGGEHGNQAYGRTPDRPMQTIAGNINKALVEAVLAGPAEGAPPSDRREMVAAFLVLYYGEGGQWQKLDEPMKTVVTKARLGLVEVALNGVPYVVTDIRMRMLTPRELARAQGFPDSYILTGTKAQQIERIGNSVCPPVARASVEANFGPRASELVA